MIFHRNILNLTAETLRIFLIFSSQMKKQEKRLWKLFNFIWLISFSPVKTINFIALFHDFTLLTLFDPL